MKLWLEAQTDLLFIANFLRKQDRIAAGKYIVTGDLLGGTTGSIVMFSNPEGSGALSLGPNFLATILFSLLIEEWKKPQCKNILEAALNVVSKRIDICSRLV